MWYNEVGKDSDIVVSSRIRLARNVSGIRFPNIFSEDEAKSVCNKVRTALKKSELEIIDISHMDEITKQSLIENHVISPDFAAKAENALLVINENEDISIMINEEDHIRIQVMHSGLDFESIYKEASILDKTLSKIGYAYSDKYGYLTSCPTNTGTGMRISAMLHLPGLTKTGDITTLLKDANSFGITIRGMYGEGTSSFCDVYQLSNQITMGIDSKSTIKNIEEVVKNIAAKERKARELIMKSSLDLEDKVYRSYGLLKYARKMTSKEAMQYIFNTKLGIDMGNIKDENNNTMLRLYNNIQSANLQKILGKRMTIDERDIERANYIRKELNK